MPDYSTVVRMTRRVAGSAATLGLVLFSLAVARSDNLSVTETGSTLILPLFKSWVSAYAAIDKALHISVAGTGSGEGIAQVIANRVQIGTSDAYMSDKQSMANPDVRNIPLAISAQAVEVNLPELRGSGLKLSGAVLAGIYSGKISSWDASPIAELNRGVRLPHHAIATVRRADSSGDTFIFTQFLSFSTGEWENGIGYGTTVHWPAVSGARAVSGNQEMVRTIAGTPYSVGYLGGSWEKDAEKAGLEMAMLQNQDGKFLLPNAATITAAADALTPRTPADERLTLVFAPGANSYPLINYEYAIVSDKQPDPQVAAALRKFLLWCIAPEGGSEASYLAAVNFITLPTTIRALSEIQIAKIQSTSALAVRRQRPGTQSHS